MIQITGLWLNKSRNGETYMKGRINGVDVLIFKNKHKTDEKHPDYQLYIAPRQNRTESVNSIDEESPFEDIS